MATWVKYGFVITRGKREGDLIQQRAESSLREIPEGQPLLDAELHNNVRFSELLESFAENPFPTHETYEVPQWAPPLDKNGYAIVKPGDWERFLEASEREKEQYRIDPNEDEFDLQGITPTIDYTHHHTLGENVRDVIAAREERLKKEASKLYDKAGASPEGAAAVDIQALEDYLRDEQPNGANTVDATLKHIERFKKQEAANGKGDGKTLMLKSLNELYKKLGILGKQGGMEGHYAGEIKNIITGLGEKNGRALYQQAREAYRRYAAEFKNKGVNNRLLAHQLDAEGGKIYNMPSSTMPEHVLSQRRDELIRVRDTLLAEGDKGKEAWANIVAHAYDRIRNAALGNITPDTKGNRVPSPYKLEAILKNFEKNGTLDVLFGETRANELRDLKELVNVLYTDPKGTKNHSGTAGFVREVIRDIQSVLPRSAKYAISKVGVLTESQRHARDVERALSKD